MIQTLVWFISYSKCSNWCQISKLLSNFGCLFSFCYFALANQIKTKLQTCKYLTNWPVHKLQICKSVLIEFEPSKEQEVNKHPKFDNNFDIRRQLQHFKYDMDRTQEETKECYNVEWTICNIYC